MRRTFLNSPLLSPCLPAGTCPRTGVWTSCRARTVRNANGVLKQSPRLAHSAYLGSRVRTRCQPQWGCVPSPPSTSGGPNQMTNNDRHVRESSHNPVGVAVVVARQPNVVRQSRDNVGLWDGAPLGLINVQTPACGQRCPRSRFRRLLCLNPPWKCRINGNSVLQIDYHG